MTVEVPEIPSKCRCSCPATGICRHILTALLYLRDSAELASCDSPVQATLFETGEPASAASGLRAAEDCPNSRGGDDSAPTTELPSREDGTVPFGSAPPLQPRFWQAWATKNCRSGRARQCCARRSKRWPRTRR